MKHLSALLGLLLFTTANLYGQGPDWQWIKKSGNKNSHPSDIATDPDGNVYIIGGMDGTDTFGNFILKANGDYDMYIVKYAPDGTVIWAKNSDGIGSEYGAGVSCDANGNIYTCGNYSTDGHQPATFFAQTTLSPSLLDDIFVMKMDKNGNVLWANTGGGQWDDFFHFGGIACDNIGNVYLNGIVEDTAHFGPFTLPGKTRNAFTAKYDSQGNIQWAKSFGGNMDDGGFGIGADASGNIYSTGFYSDTARFDNLTIVNPNKFATLYLIKQKNDGTIDWVKNVTCDNTTIGFNLAIAQSGNIFVAGVFDHQVQAGIFNFTSNDRAYLILEYDANGNVVWADTINKPYIYQNDVVIDAYDQPLMVADRCFVKWNNQKNKYWRINTKTFTHCITRNKEGNIYIAGNDADSLNGVAIHGSFIAKLGLFSTSVYQQPENYNLHTYPNPAQDHIYIAGKETGEYVITDMKGSIMLSGNIDKNRSIYTGSLIPAVYSIRLTTKNNKLQSTFIKE